MATAPTPFFSTTVVPPPPCGCGAPAYASCSCSPAAAYPPNPFPGGYYPSPFPLYSNPPASPYAASPTSAYGSSACFPVPATSQASSTRSDPTLLNDLALQLELARQSLIDMSRQLDECQARSKCSFASLKRGISKLVDMVPTSESSTSTTPSFFSGATSSTVTSTVLFPGSASFGSISHVSVLNNTVTLSGSAAMTGNTQHPEAQPIHFGNLQVSTTMQDASSVFSQMPEQYGFHNLSRQTVFRADGTEHSYYRLPENYPLELACPEPVFDVYDDDMDGCSTEFVDVLTSTPAQPTDEEEQHENIQALKCFRKPQFSVEKPTVGVFILTNDQSSSVTAPVSVAAQAAGLDAVLRSKTDGTFNSESLLVPNLQLPWNLHDASHVFTKTHVCDVYEENSACLNIASDVQDFTLQLQQQDDKREGNCSVLKSSNSFVTRSSQLSIEHSMTELRLLWDPGAKTFSVLFLTAADTTKLQYNSLYVCLWDPGIGISSSMSHRSPSLTAATESPLPSSKTSDSTTWLSQVNSASYAWDPGTMLLLYMSIWLLVFREEKAMVTPILEQCSFWFIKYYGVALWLIHFLPP